MLHLPSLCSMISALGAGLSIVGDTKKKNDGNATLYPALAGRPRFSPSRILPSFRLLP